MNKINWKWTNIDTGEIIETKERRFNNCPKCKEFCLHTNRYKSLEVISHNDDINDISICINMVYCSICCELWIRQDY
jgi:hypothetical protein